MDFSITSAGAGMGVRPLNYAVNNESSYSDAYNASVKKAQGAKNVNAVSPVRYPDAEMYSKDTEAVKDEGAAGEIKVMAAYNQTAAGFEGRVTGYSASGVSTGYSQIGGGFDAFA